MTYRTTDSLSKITFDLHKFHVMTNFINIFFDNSGKNLFLLVPVLFTALLGLFLWEARTKHVLSLGLSRFSSDARRHKLTRDFLFQARLSVQITRVLLDTMLPQLRTLHIFLRSILLLLFIYLIFFIFGWICRWEISLETLQAQVLALLEGPPPADAPKTLVGFLEEPLARRTPLDSLKQNLVTFIYWGYSWWSIPTFSFPLCFPYWF